MKRHKLHRFIKPLVPFLFIFTVVACTTQKTSGVVETASIPLNDLNLVRSKIPAVLEQAKKAPYAVPTDPSCASLNKMITALDEVLAPDIDAPAQKSNKTTKAASSAINSAVKNLVPFRGWLRKLSGAERHSKKVSNAIAAGVVRRAFIKGMRAIKACQ